jgi:hypothetical protein
MTRKIITQRIIDPSTELYHEFRPELKLAAAVIHRGCLDIADGDHFALRWLDTTAFEFWCYVLDLNPDWLRKHMKQLAP